MSDKQITPATFAHYKRIANACGKSVFAADEEACSGDHPIPPYEWNGKTVEGSTGPSPFRGEQLRQYMHDAVASMQQMIFVLQHHVRRIADQQVQDFEKTDTDQPMKVYIKVDFWGDQDEYNTRRVQEQLEKVFPADQIAEVKESGSKVTGYVCKIKQAHVIQIEEMEWVESITAI